MWFKGQMKKTLHGSEQEIKNYYLYNLIHHNSR